MSDSLEQSSQTRILEQARFVHETVNLLKRRVAARTVLTQPGCDGGPGLELTWPQMNMLIAVRERGQVTIKELAEALEVSASSASTMVDRLVEMGPLTREQSRVDRRTVVVQLSPEAETAIDRCEAGILDCIVELLEKVGPEYAEKWCDVYAKIREVLTEEPAKTGDRSANRRVVT